MDHEDREEPAGGHLSRRSALKRGGIAAGAAGGLLWAAPSVLSFDAVAAASAPRPTSAAGIAVNTNGNSSSPLNPVGTFSIFLLVTAGDGAVPTTATTGWTQIVTSGGAAPFFSVYWALGTAAAPTVAKGTNGNNRYTAQVFGFNPGTGPGYTSAVAGTVATNPPTTSVAGLAGQPANSAFVFAGVSTADATWALPPASNYVTIPPQAVFIPDVYAALNNLVGTSIGAVTPTTFGAGTAKGVQIALRV